MHMSTSGSSMTFRLILTDALRYWERRRIAYNLILTAAVVAWVVFTWPHFRGGLSLESVTALLILAAIANILYCAAYAADLPMQYSSMRETWLRWRWCLWWAGTLFALLLTNYWIADEIFPDAAAPL